MKFYVIEVKPHYQYPSRWIVFANDETEAFSLIPEADRAPSLLYCGPLGMVMSEVSIKELDFAPPDEPTLLFQQHDDSDWGLSSPLWFLGADEANRPHRSPSPEELGLATPTLFDYLSELANDALSWCKGKLPHG